MLTAGSVSAETAQRPVSTPAGPPKVSSGASPPGELAAPLRQEDLPRLRVVLRGALYRSGSPSEGAIEQLCRNRWQRVYSLYGDRTTMRGPRNPAMIERGVDERRCAARDGGEHALAWQPALAAARNRTLPLVFRDVITAVREPARGPVLIHCWNGLHSAGMIAAMALRQFCGLSGEDGAAYWLATTSHATAYPYMVEHIRDFRPLPGFSLTPEERRRVCPDLNHPAEWRTALTSIPVSAGVRAPRTAALAPTSAAAPSLAAASAAPGAPAASAAPGASAAPAALPPLSAGARAARVATGAANPTAASISLRR